ncbi:hypothetical protein QBC41DRAFT_56902 [Cercophora samala]|uniref:F-box domain-containing protein n=1 Tax=Cercophora samala TaxID=330535 RepID=A0AA39ZI52_9PEZI|nr:hypothetical protein QBC41DRAFT_56902 [Cercophora samala]
MARTKATGRRSFGGRLPRRRLKSGIICCYPGPSARRQPEPPRYSLRPRRQHTEKPQEQEQIRRRARRQDRALKKRSKITPKTRTKRGIPLGLFSRLPNELIYRIITSDFDIPTLVKLRLVCRFFKTTIDTQVKAYAELSQKFPAFLQRIIVQTPTWVFSSSCEEVHAKLTQDLPFTCKGCNEREANSYTASHWAFNLMTGEFMCNRCSGGNHRRGHGDGSKLWVERHLKKHLTKAGIAFTQEMLQKIPHVRVVSPWEMDCKWRRRPAYGRPVTCYDPAAVQKEFGLAKTHSCGCWDDGYPRSEDLMHGYRATIIPMWWFAGLNGGRPSWEKVKFQNPGSY